MKHLKTFNSYNMINEGLLNYFFDELKFKVKKAFKNIKNSFKRKAADEIFDLLEKHKYHPRLRDVLSRARAGIHELPHNDKKEILKIALEIESETKNIDRYKSMSKSILPKYVAGLFSIVGMTELVDLVTSLADSSLSSAISNLNEFDLFTIVVAIIVIGEFTTDALRSFLRKKQ